MKKIILSVLLILCLSITGLVYADENLNDAANIAGEGVICTMDVMVCPSGMTVPRVPELNCEFAPCPEYSSPNVVDPTTSAGETNLNQPEDTPIAIGVEPTTDDKRECQEQVRIINVEIIEKDKAYKTELQTILPGYLTAKREYIMALNTYKQCISAKISTKITDSTAAQSGMTANVVMANANMDERWIRQNASVTTSPQVASAMMPVEQMDIDKLDLEIVELPETNSLDCKEQRDTLKEKQTTLKAEIEKIKALREKYKADDVSVKELQAQRQEIIRNCYPGNSAGIIKEECTVPKELLEKRKELEQRLMELQTEFTSTDVSSKEEFMLKHRQIKEELGYVLEKINSIEKACKQTARVITQENRCQPDEGLIQEMEKIKKSLSTETDPNTIYELKIALEYVLKKMNTKCGISPTDTTTEVAIKPVSEAEILKQEIQRLKIQIQERDNEIKSLRESMKKFTGEFKSANTEQKTRLLEENFEDVLAHTTAVINGRIAELEEKINNIEIAENISDENKKEMISNLNDRIASLTQILDKLTNATTAEELKQIMTNARKIDERAILEGRITSLTKSILKLSEIVEKHYVDSENYESYKTSISELSIKVSALTEDTTTKEFNTLVENYKTLKEEIITDGRKMQPKGIEVE